jgi:hypothetical protein
VSYRLPQRHRSDGNQSPLVKLFIQLGGLWIPYANKPFDGWAYHAHFGYLPVELKNPNGRRKPGAHDEYTPRQKKVMQLLQLKQAPWLVWRTEEDVFRCCGARRTA